MNKSDTIRWGWRASVLACVTAGLAASALAAGGTTQLVWSYPSGSEGWTPKAVSIGNNGTQVFSRVGPVADHTRLFSAHDQDPPSAVWTHSETVWTHKHQVDSANESNIHASIHEVFVSGTSGPKRPVVQKFTSSSSTPDWTYPIPTDHYGSEPIDIGVSSDGQVIVAMSYDLEAGHDPRVIVFGPNSPVPQSNTVIPTTGAPTEMHLSGDGRTLYIWGAYKLTVVDVPTTQVIWTEIIFNDTIWRGHALSHDGRTLAFGAANTLRIYKRSGQQYSETHQYTFPIGYRAEAIAISADGSTLACGANAPDNLTVRVLAMNLDNYQVTMLNQQTGLGTKSNVVSDIGIARDGSTFAVGLWGDELGLVPEVQFFDSRQNLPIGSYNLPGSVLAVDLSLDGSRLVTASKSVHANDFAGNGSISLFDARGVDFRAIGVPVPGSTVEFELYSPGLYPSSALLIMSPSLAPTPDIFPGAGTLYLQRNDLTFYSMGQIGPDGFARRDLQISPSTQLGTSLYYQGLRSSPRTLSEDWVQLTVVP